MSYVPGGLIQHPKWCRGGAHIRDGCVVLDKDAAQPYDVEDANYWDALPFRLARLVRANHRGNEILDRREVVRFVKDYGMLWTGPDHLVSKETAREALETWHKAATKLRRVVDLYEERRKAVRKVRTASLREDDYGSEDLEPVRMALRTLRDLDGSTETIPTKDLECLRYAGDRLAIVINEERDGAALTLVPAYRLLPVGPDPVGLDDFVYTYHFTNLLAAAYDRFSYHVATKVEVLTCVECGGPFVRTHGNQVYCGSRCTGRAEKRRQRNRKKQTVDTQRHHDRVTDSDTSQFYADHF